MAILVSGFMTVVGCGESDKGPKTVPAEGVVTLDGEPVEGASVAIVNDIGKNARGRTDEDGHFELTAFEYKSGAEPGEYKVIVSRTIVETASDGPRPGSEEAEHAGEAAGQRVYNDLPAKYAQATGELMVNIPEEGTKDIKLELSSK